MRLWPHKAREIKAPTPGKLFLATVGRHGFGRLQSQIDFNRPTGDMLARRYGMWVHRCIQINARAAAAIPFKLMRITASPRAARSVASCLPECRLPSRKTKAFLARSAGPVKPSESVRKRLHGNLERLVEIEDHPLLTLLHDVNDWTDGFAFREALYSDLYLFGRAFVHLIDPAGAPDAMWRMLPHRVRVMRHPVDFVSHFEMDQDGREVRFETSEVLWFRLYDPTDPWGGVGAVEAWLSSVDSAFHIQAFQNELMTRFGTPDAVIVSKTMMSQEQKDVIRRDWRRLFGRMFKRREAIAFLSGDDIDIKRLGQTNRELEYQASEESKRDQIGNAFGVGKALLTTDDVNRANAREARLIHIENTVWPMIQLVEDALNAQLLPKFGEGLFLVHDNPIPDDETIRIEERRSKLESGWTVNEIRMEEGVEPLDLPEADMPLVAQTLQPLEKIDEEPMPMMGGPPGMNGQAEPENGAEPPKGLSVSVPVAIHQHPDYHYVAAPSVEVPLSFSPRIDVKHPAITIEPQHILAHFDVEAPIVDVAAPNVDVEAPVVNVEAPIVEVSTPDIMVEPRVTVLPADVKVDARPDVKVEPKIDVNLIEGNGHADP